MFIPDPLSRTVKIPVKMVKGVLCLDPEGPLPAIEHGTRGELIIPAYALEDSKLVEKFNDVQKKLCLPKETLLAAKTNPGGLSQDLLNKLDSDREVPGTYVRIVLQEDLFIFLRGTKIPTLSGCKCFIPLLEKEARSINHAYALISQTFEPERMSHTGNVFAKIYYFDGRQWCTLERRRNQIDSENTTCPE